MTALRPICSLGCAYWWCLLSANNNFSSSSPVRSHHQVSAAQDQQHLQREGSGLVRRQPDVRPGRGNLTDWNLPVPARILLRGRWGQLLLALVSKTAIVV